MDISTNSVRTRRIAMLIDGDNAQPSLIGNMLAETSKYGLVIIRRIYGDWTTANMNGWKDTLQTYAVQPIQQFRYTIGKNATDSAMIIDAMDTLYGGGIDGFCLVSSDSDYTRLATRIREKGFFVMGVGKRMTPRAFVNACDVFVFTENLIAEANNSTLLRRSTQSARSNTKRSTRDGGKMSDGRTSDSRTGSRGTGSTGQMPAIGSSSAAGSAPTAEAPRDAETSHDSDEPSAEALPLLIKAFDLAVQDDGWAFLGVMGSHIRQLDPSFDPRTFGYKQLSALIKAYTKVFEVKPGKKSDGTFNVYVRMKE